MKEPTMNKDPRSFDATRSLVAVAFASVHDHDFTVGTEIKIVKKDEDFALGEVTLDEAIHLWRADKIDYTETARPTPVASPEDEAERLTEIEDLGGGWFLIRAPWLHEGEKVQGREAADARYAEVVQLGVDGPAAPATEAEAPTTFEAREAGSNGVYEITGPGVKPYKIRGKDAAQAEADKLNGVSAPEGEVKTD